NQQAGTGTMRSSADIARDGRGTEAAKQAMLAQRQALLDGPVLAVMLKLALPTVIVLVVQSFVGVAETYFVSFLGTDALAGVALAASLAYADAVFAGAVLVWVVSLLAAALRGAGNTIVPAAVTFGAVFVLLPLSPLLIFGWGPFPRLGVMGAGVAVVIYYVVAA